MRNGSKFSQFRVLLGKNWWYNLWSQQFFNSLSRSRDFSLSLDCLSRLGSLSLSLSFSQRSPKAWRQLRVFFHPFHFFSSHFFSSCPMTNHNTIIHNVHNNNKGPKNVVFGQQKLCVWATTICVWSEQKKSVFETHFYQASGQA